ncbi:MAG: M20/M25/M40 family metallo-hydrolase [Silvanigrellales bacterium]|nr:M20/M25/M40 family metallo-hydrolase [Silvanigrellales bacterium]
MEAPTAETQRALDYCEKNLRGALEDLSTLVKIPSVSLEGFDPNALQLSAEAVAHLLSASGLEKVEVMQFGSVHPYVYAEWMHKPGAPTLLLYAHHDVQPPGEEAKWRSHPFCPTESGGRLYGRGAADDKAGILAHAAAIAAFLKTSGELPVNVKVIIEGEEETGSTHLAEFTRRYRDRLSADAMILTDCANIETGIPSITTALRGLVAIDIEVEALSHSVHSGLWGGILPDPNLALARILAGLVDDRGHILVPGVLDDVVPLSPEEERGYAQLKMESTARKATGLLDEIPFLAPERDFAKNLWRRPHLSVNAVQSGSRKLVSNVIQNGAWARVSLRIVPNMDPLKVASQVESYVKSLCPQGFRLSTRLESAGQWWSAGDTSSAVYEIASRALEKGYGHTTQFIGCGASIPFVQPLSQELGGIPAVLVGVEDPYTNAHSENESLELSDFRKTLMGQIHMLADMAKYKRA